MGKCRATSEEVPKVRPCLFRLHVTVRFSELAAIATRNGHGDIYPAVSDPSEDGCPLLAHTALLRGPLTRQLCLIDSNLSSSSHLPPPMASALLSNAFKASRFNLARQVSTPLIHSPPTVVVAPLFSIADPVRDQHLNSRD